jgi:hypothetical protein
MKTQDGVEFVPGMTLYEICDDMCIGKHYVEAFATDDFTQPDENGVLRFQDGFFRFAKTLFASEQAARREMLRRKFFAEITAAEAIAAAHELGGKTEWDRGYRRGYMNAVNAIFGLTGADFS